MEWLSFDHEGIDKFSNSWQQTLKPFSFLFRLLQTKQSFSFHGLMKISLVFIEGGISTLYLVYFWFLGQWVTFLWPFIGSLQVLHRLSLVAVLLPLGSCGCSKGTVNRKSNYALCQATQKQKWAYSLIIKVKIYFTYLLQLEGPPLIPFSFFHFFYEWQLLWVPSPTLTPLVVGSSV